MTHDRLKPIIQAICMACDYQDNDIKIKADEIWDTLFPINPTMNNKHSEMAVYAILHTALELAKEYECQHVNNATESLSQEEDSNDICPLVMEQKNQQK